MNVIEIKDVSKLYGFGDAATIALEEATLTVTKGEFLAIMGPSGSGKSTLMNIVGLLDRPTQGTYHLSGKNVSRIRPNRQAKVRRDNIGFIFQSYNLLPRMTVLDNVALPLAYKRTSRVVRQERAAEILAKLGLHERQYYFPSQLSGGQLQRVAIARALINNPSIILADEPTGNLDSENSQLIMELLKELHQNGNTILIVTHNPELTKFATRVIYMHDGKIMTDRPLRGDEIADVEKLSKEKPKRKRKVTTRKKAPVKRKSAKSANAKKVTAKKS